MNDTLIDKLLIAAAVVAVLAAGAFYGLKRVDWSTPSVATGEPTITPTGSVSPAVDAPTATVIGARPEASTDHLLLTPGAVPAPTDVPAVESTPVQLPTEVLPTPDAAEPTFEGSDGFIPEPTSDPNFPPKDDGTTDGTTDGMPDGTTDGSTDEPTDGMTDGSTDGTTDGMTDGSTDGTTDGMTDGSTDGTTDGSMDGGALIPTAIPEPTATPEPTARPSTVVRGRMSWTGLRAVTMDVVVPAGTELIVEPGTTLLLSPGVSFFVDGTLRLNGTYDKPIYLTRANDGAAPWGGIFIQTDGEMTSNDAHIWHGGAAATLISVEQGSLTIADSEIRHNHGQIRVTNATFLLQKSTIRDNELAFGAMIDTTYESNGAVQIDASRVGPNTGGDGAVVAVRQSGDDSQVQLTLSSSVLQGTTGTNLVVDTHGIMSGSVVCTTFSGGSMAVRVESTLSAAPGLPVSFRQSAFINHGSNGLPPRVFVSNIGVDAKQNWWGAASGPYHPKSNPGGTGEANGVNVTASEWLRSWPSCAPQP